MADEPKKYYLVEKIRDAEGYSPKCVVGEFSTIEDALDRFNKDLKGDFLGAPDLTGHPEAYVIKGKKIPVKIKKTGVTDQR